MDKYFKHHNSGKRIHKYLEDVNDDTLSFDIKSNKNNQNEEGKTPDVESLSNLNLS